MFVNEGYENYKYLVEAHDNYLVLSNSRSIDGTWEFPDTINVIYQYLKPSFLTIEGRYTSSSSKTFSQVDISSDFNDRADLPEIYTGSFFIILLTVFIFNKISKLFVKGGV